MDPYRVLRISRNASRKEVKAAFQRLVMELHPDRTGRSACLRANAAPTWRDQWLTSQIPGGDEAKTQEFLLVKEAYALLKDPGKAGVGDGFERIRTYVSWGFTRIVSVMKGTGTASWRQKEERRTSVFGTVSSYEALLAAAFASLAALTLMHSLEGVALWRWGARRRTRVGGENIAGGL
eukprot:scaffold657_cov245-Pinguiococcus_pyrenoidosus.AAC.14